MSTESRGRNPTIYNVTCAVASTQYSQLLATGTKSIQVQARVATNVILLGWVSGAVTSRPFLTIRSNYMPYSEANLDLGMATMFVASPVTGAVVEIASWR